MLNDRELNDVLVNLANELDILNRRHTDFQNRRIWIVNYKYIKFNNL